ncbi:MULTISPECIES: hypothetical protein [unclassified Variovorax]|uniref:hypothetical protein n=1 Tax=unclassified Variovorax TaxID=663243 RepID=UPI002B22DA42|nr:MULTISPECIES: hypothetical protein [unclassified Variovorax]MEB0056012.1 hypothetical protein [Variovorax sp. LG9.2]MEB0111149.1 hypothetical protein [Variovorax sp. RTB1]
MPQNIRLDIRAISLRGDVASQRSVQHWRLPVDQPLPRRVDGGLERAVIHCPAAQIEHDEKFGRRFGCTPPHQAR